MPTVAGNAGTLGESRTRQAGGTALGAGPPALSLPLSVGHGPQPHVPAGHTGRMAAAVSATSHNREVLGPCSSGITASHSDYRALPVEPAVTAPAQSTSKTPQSRAQPDTLMQAHLRR